MQLVAVVRPPPELDGAIRLLAEAAGLTKAEARMRLMPEPPAVVARLAAEEALALAGRLEAGGLAVVCAPSHVTSERTQVRRVAVEADRFVFQPRTGEALEMGFSDITAIFRGASSQRSRTEAVEQVKRFDVGTAFASGGMKMTKKSEVTTRTQSESIEQTIFVYDGANRCAVLHELGMEFAWMGPALQPSRTANMTAIARLLQERAPQAVFDDRLLRLGRRPMPLLSAAETQVRTTTSSTSTQDTASVLDLLAELLHEAVRRRLVP